MVMWFTFWCRFGVENTFISLLRSGDLFVRPCSHGAQIQLSCVYNATSIVTQGTIAYANT